MVIALKVLLILSIIICVFLLARNNELWKRLEVKAEQDIVAWNMLVLFILFIYLIYKVVTM